MVELTIYLQIVLEGLLNKRSHVAFESAIFFCVSMLCLDIRYMDKGTQL